MRPDRGLVSIDGERSDGSAHVPARRARAWATCRRRRRSSADSPCATTCEPSWRRPGWRGALRRERLEGLLAELRLGRRGGPESAHSPAASGVAWRSRVPSRARPRSCCSDEPFTGIDPIAVGDIQEIIAGLARRGLGVLITDHNVRETLHITNRAYILFKGRVLISGTAQELAENPKLARSTGRPLPVVEGPWSSASGSHRSKR